MARPALRVGVTTKDQNALRKLLSGGVQQVRVVLRAIALLQMAKGVSAPRVSAVVPLTPQAIRKVGHRYQQGGLERALYEKERPGAAALLEDSQRQRIIAMVCSDPPEGRARWTVRLVVKEAVKRRLVLRIGREIIRVLVLHHDLKPWREKMCAWPTSMRTTSPRWRTCSRRMSDPTIPNSRWSAWTRSRHAARRCSGRPRRSNRGEQPDATTSTNAAARSMFSVR